MDPVFGSGGIVLAAVGNFGKINDMALQPDGKIIAAGIANSTNSRDFGLARFNPNGTLDTSFGVNGTVITDLGGQDVINGVALQNDGKIVAAGRTGFSADGWAVARYNADGSLDSTFGLNGVVITDLLPGSDVAYDVAVQGDGKIVVVGQASPSATISTTRFAVVRYNADGSLDTTFGGGAGYVLTADFGTSDASPNKVLLQPNGDIIALGHSSTSGGNFGFAAVRYNANGTIDPDFGANGIVKLTAGFGSNGFEDLRDAVLLPDGNIVAGGGVLNNVTHRTEIAVPSVSPPPANSTRTSAQWHDLRRSRLGRHP